MTSIAELISNTNDRFENKEYARLVKHCRKMFTMIAKRLHKQHKIKNNKIYICSGMGSTSIWVYSVRFKKLQQLGDFFKFHALTGHDTTDIEKTLQSIEDEFYWDWTKAAPYKFWLNADGIDIIEE